MILPSRQEIRDGWLRLSSQSMLCGAAVSQAFLRAEQKEGRREWGLGRGKLGTLVPSPQIRGG
jgi:hypothetical protein